MGLKTRVPGHRLCNQSSEETYSEIAAEFDSETLARHRSLSIEIFELFRGLYPLATCTLGVY